MKEPYQIILDVWEANTDFDPVVLLKEKVAGVIVRLNDMNGGHHLDKNLSQNWEKAKKFPVQAIYFVYNPWVSGAENAKWLLANLPKDYGKRRIFIDVEVRYTGISPATYSSGLKVLMAEVRKTNPCTIYSGGGFINLLSEWPKEEYWWAAYSSWLSTAMTWEDYKNILASLDFDLFTKLSPGPCKLWQCTGDGVKLPGFGYHAVDTNVIVGTLEEVTIWFGCSDQTGGTDDTSDTEDTSMAIPIGLYTRVDGWTKVNPNYNFIIGGAQIEGTVDPNPRIKPIQVETEGKKIPFMLGWDHLPWAYSEQQWGVNNWPTESADYIFQNFKTIMGARNYSAVVVFAGTFLNKAGKEEDKQFVAFSLQKFMERVQSWLKANRPLVPLILATSNDFIAAHAPDINNWAHRYENMAWQKAAKIENSYPAPDLKPAYLGASAECPWWRYLELATSGLGKIGLVIFRGQNGYAPTLEGMYSWLNLSLNSDPGTDQPPDPTGELDMVKISATFQLLETEMAELRRLLKLS